MRIFFNFWEMTLQLFRALRMYVQCTMTFIGIVYLLSMTFFWAAPNVTIGNRLPHPGHPAPPQQQNPTLTGLLNNPPQGQAGMPQQQQPGNPMGQPQPGMPVMHGMQRPQMPGQLQPGQPQQRMPMGPQNPIWKGALQWTEKTNQQNAINRINCSVTAYQANPQVVKIMAL